MADGKTRRTEDPREKRRRERQVSERTCIVTRKTHLPEDLIRFVTGPDNEVVPDLARRLPGRGVWVLCNRDCIEQAVRTRAFGRGLKAEVKVPEDLAERIERLLVQRSLESLALARKAGAVTSGFSKLDAALGQGAIAALLHAREARADGAGKLDRKFRAVREAMGLTAPVVTEFSSDQLSLTIGRANVVHAGLGEGGATTRFLRETRRLANFRMSATPLASNTSTP